MASEDYMTSVEEFCLRTEELLKQEREAELEESRCSQENVSPKLLEKRGICLTKLIIDGRKTSLYGRQILTLKPSNVNRPELPANAITTGDIIGLHQVAVPIAISSGIVVKIASTYISVAFDQSEELSETGDDCQYYVVKLANDVTYKRLRRALSRLRNYRRCPADCLIDLAFSRCGDNAAAMDIKPESISFFNTCLDSSQREAVHLALSQRNLAIIHGPPGTGKSTTVIEVIRQFVSQGLRVLACAPSNVAVDNLVLRLAKAKVCVTRLGHPARAMHEIQSYSLDAKISASDESSIVEDIRREIDEALKKMRHGKGTSGQQSSRTELKSLRKELKQRSDEAVRRILKGSEVILSTLTSATEDGPLRILEDMHFDVVVIDECSQSLEAACWIALLQAPKCVLAGDHLQLPPTILSHKAAAGGLAVTLMERLISSHATHVHMLTVQYRMNQAIMQWASDELYSSKLTAAESVANHLLQDLMGAETNEITAGALVLIDTAGCDLQELDLPDEQSRGNEGEADLVAIHIESLIESGVRSGDIAVISPYNLQVELIRNRLSDKYRDLEIKSVDGYQGREKEAVVISLVRSNNKGVVGFLSEDRRLNVAVTRARRQVAVICDSSTVRKHAFLGRFIDYMTDNGIVRSAAEFQQDHDIGRISEKIAGLMKNQTDIRSSGAKAKPKAKKDQPQKVSTNKTKASATTRQSSTEKGHLDRPEVQSATREQKEERESRIRGEMQAIISAFVKGDLPVYNFPSTLNSFERMIVHQIAESYGLDHSSTGEGADRHILVKKAPKTKTEKRSNIGSDLSAVGLIESSHVGGILERTIEPKGTDTKPATVTDLVNGSNKETLSSPFTCALCGKVVPQANIPLHQLRCSVLASDNGAVQDDSCRQKTSRQRSANQKSSNQLSTEQSSSNRTSKDMSNQDAKSHKPKKNKKAKLTVDDGALLSKVAPDDFDALLAAADRLNSVCNFRKCKILVKTLGTNCLHCSLRFCLNHGMPEVHGCGTAAKVQARVSIVKEGRLYSGSGIPNKKPNAATRANLERKLDKKMSEFTAQRKPKEKDK